jgi:hypothetical protein
MNFQSGSEVKRAVTGRLSELLEMKVAPKRESAAYSLGRLRFGMALETVGPRASEVQK